jgi:predicted MFS family arabinose efflux permease
LDEREEGLDQPGLVEDILLGPTIPHGGALPPHVLTIRPFLWIVLGVAAAGLAFWAFLAAVFAQAAFEFHASSPEMAVLSLSISAPYAVFIPLQGVVVDRWSPKWMNLCGYLALVAAVPIAWAARSLVPLYVSTALVGVAFATIEPARSSLTGLLVDEHRLVQANGMISAANQLSLMVGTLAGGFLTQAVGVRAVYAAAAAVSVLPIGFNLAVPDARQGGERPAVSLRDLGQGLRTVRRVPEIRLLVVVGCVAWLMVTTFLVLEPIFIKQVLHQGESAVSFLWFIHGLGAMLGAIAVSRTRRSAGRELLLVAGGVTTVGIGLLLFSAIVSYPVAFLGEALMGAGFSFIFAPGLALIQRAAGEEQRGRVTSIFGSLQEMTGIVSSVAIIALGSLVVIRPTLCGTGAFVILTGAIAFRAAIRLRARVAAEREPDR